MINASPVILPPGDSGKLAVRTEPRTKAGLSRGALLGDERLGVDRAARRKPEALILELQGIET